MIKFITIIYVYLFLNILPINAEQLAPIDVLFLGSIDENIDKFEPISDYFRNVDEGEVIVANPSIKLASCYLFK